MRFTKMHGAGNDYVYVDCFAEPVPADPERLAIVVSDRHRGIGADGLILICPSAVADAEMRMWNADGSQGEMCGNGIRCVAKYLFERGIVRRTEMRIATGRGILELQLQVERDAVVQVRVDMGRPMFQPQQIPTLLMGTPPIDVELSEVCPQLARATSLCREDASGLRGLRVTCLSMGNPHCVSFVDELTDELLLGTGPLLETHAAFPNRVNVEFVQVVSASEIRLRVWERGSGETQACGTGTCAAVVAGVLTGRTERRVLAHLPGGELEVEYAETGTVYLTGPAVEVFQGVWQDRATARKTGGIRQIA